MIPNNIKTHISVPDSTNINSSHEFTLEPSCVNEFYECMFNLQMLREERKFKHIENFHQFKNDKLKTIIY